MCGITGFWGRSDHSDQVIAHMADQIAHRGPDGAGLWEDRKTGLAMAHRRLAIVDLSPAGHQPMTSSCGRYTIVFNGEIYNHLEIRDDLRLAGIEPNWRGHSDTETLLACCVHWGFEASLQRLNGMFAFSLWDSQKQQLFLARDRVGEKPLYYGRNSGTFLFGSELKAITAYPLWQGDVDRNALALFIRYHYVPSPKSIYKDIYKLPPAHYIVVSDGGHSVSNPKCYWDLSQVATAEKNARFSETSIDELEVLMRDSVRLRMAADVPLGAFLSGGYDSSTVVALMQDQSQQPVQTFSIGFHEEGYNEAHHAKKVAQYLGTKHTELYVTSEQALDVVPKLATMYDEPFADISQIPTFLVSQLARQHVTVSLSGDGGDELFCGYNRYSAGYQVWNKMRHLPPIVRRGLAEALGYMPVNSFLKMQGYLPSSFQFSGLSDQLPKLVNALSHSDGAAFYTSLVSHVKEPDTLVLGSNTSGQRHDFIQAQDMFSDLREQMMFWDTSTYLPDDILCKVDRASMAVSLEARVPLLDHRLIEFAWRMPLNVKYRDGQAKWAMRQVMYRYLPKDLMDRPKMGFSVPLEDWLKGPLRDWAEAQLDTSRLKREGYFDPIAVRKMWDDHISGKKRAHFPLWGILMFQSWVEHQKQT